MNGNRLCCAAALVLLASALAVGFEKPAASSAPLRYSLTLVLSRGDRITETTVEDDRVEWKLPKRRLEDFRRSGIVIDEEHRTTTQARAVVVAATAHQASLHGSASLETLDIPRNLRTTVQSPFSMMIDAGNTRAAGRSYSLQEAAMVQLPPEPLPIGHSWTTRETVLTTLGSGEATLTHTLVSAGKLLKIRVHGGGAITGVEYKLPKLLPGSMSIDGFAWYDPSSKLITRERYAIDNRLLKPDGAETIGFEEKLEVAVDTRLLRQPSP
ncbi:MAG: hypothetical protein DLM53_08495 [Candidatus Eremiobacter antarcticus]|nr:hypothetical protein [Candidatus Eremiobacteraeota bacterium]MBC5809133.1 hypothetical protein [Candidatus Eremiobacteraeota bacterium]PZR61613.1 MAG: hypothetical protein DLM53_08495 [Candidatus Eremiobacter sp. RRmetagenome_bin22]